MADSKRTPRRRHADELKVQVLRERQERGASVASVALAHGLNANLVHKWRRSIASGNVAVKPTADARSRCALVLSSSHCRWRTRRQRPPTSESNCAAAPRR